LSRLNDLIRQARLKDRALADDLEREVAALADRRAFGLNFERHTPETVELPGRRVRHGDKVRVLPPRGASQKKADERLWRVRSIEKDGDGQRRAKLESLPDGDESVTVAVPDLVVVAEFRDPIYPGLVSTGALERGGDKPFHTVINAENYHALQTLLFTHQGKVDCIYIDPPYNTGAKDWKYNNDYVENDDLYRHSKWLAFMERRLLLAKELLKPDDSVLIVAIDEKEHLRLGLLLNQIFPEGNVQMVTTVINATGVIRANEFTRTNEFVFFVLLGNATVAPETSAESGSEVPWNLLQRREMASRRHGSTPRPDQFYPIYVNVGNGHLEDIGVSLPLDVSRTTVPERDGCQTLWPLKPDGTEMVWGLPPASLQRLVDKGYVKVTRRGKGAASKFSVYYLTTGKVAALESGEAVVTSRHEDGSVTAHYLAGRTAMPTSTWMRESHNAQSHGTKLLSRFIPERRFPFPKSLYAVEDAVRFFTARKPDSLIVDFFGGSGTTAHAVMRLNRQDDGRRRSITVTNNEVSVEEQFALRSKGLRPGDPAWEQLGICDYITKPRLQAVVTGSTPDGDPVKGDYRFADEFPMAEGFAENVEFFTLTYEAPLRVASHREFQRIAPLLWLRAGSRGRRIDDLTQGWEVADSYGVIADLDQVEKFVHALSDQPEAVVAFVVTDEDRLFESVVRELPEHVEPVRLYEAYLRNFEIESGRGAR